MAFIKVAKGHGRDSLYTIYRGSRGLEVGRPLAIVRSEHGREDGGKCFAYKVCLIPMETTLYVPKYLASTRAASGSP